MRGESQSPPAKSRRPATLPVGRDTPASAACSARRSATRRSAAHKKPAPTATGRARRSEAPTTHSVRRATGPAPRFADYLSAFSETQRARRNDRISGLLLNLPDRVIWRAVAHKVDAHGRD